MNDNNDTNKPENKKHGFTLVELLCCIGIVGIVGGAVATFIAKKNDNEEN